VRGAGSMAEENPCSWLPAPCVFAAARLTPDGRV
jgi:hypothetical protein